MSGAKITGNTNTSTTTGAGGVYLAGGASFTMNGGEISGNTSAANAGGVYMNGAGGTFAMNGGTISGNTVSNNFGGGGVRITGNSTFTMDSGVISGNTSSGNQAGGGVRIEGNATFTMRDGVISGNQATGVDAAGQYSAGGIRASNATIQIVNGTIYGDTAAGNSNTFAGTGSNAALLHSGIGAVEYGTFVSGTWTKTTDSGFNGTLVSTDQTIEVANGVLNSPPPPTK